MAALSRHRHCLSGLDRQVHQRDQNSQRSDKFSEIAERFYVHVYLLWKEYFEEANVRFGSVAGVQADSRGTSASGWKADIQKCKNCLI